MTVLVTLALTGCVLPPTTATTPSDCPFTEHAVKVWPLADGGSVTDVERVVAAWAGAEAEPCDHDPGTNAWTCGTEPGSYAITATRLDGVDVGPVPVEVGADPCGQPVSESLDLYLGLPDDPVPGPDCTTATVDLSQLEPVSGQIPADLVDDAMGQVTVPGRWTADHALVQVTLDVDSAATEGEHERCVGPTPAEDSNTVTVAAQLRLTTDDGLVDERLTGWLVADLSGESASFTSDPLPVADWTSPWDPDAEIGSLAGITDPAFVATTGLLPSVADTGGWLAIEGTDGAFDWLTIPLAW